MYIMYVPAPKCAYYSWAILKIIYISIYSITRISQYTGL